MTLRSLLASLYEPRFRENDLLAEMAGVRAHNALLTSRNLALETRVRGLESLLDDWKANAPHPSVLDDLSRAIAERDTARGDHARFLDAHADTMVQLADERARRERAERFPNGWAQPTFMSVDDDGAIHFEWCLGLRGADEFRLLFMWCPKGGVMMCRTGRGGEQTSDETGTAAMTLRDHLEAEKRDHDAQPASDAAKDPTP